MISDNHSLNIKESVGTIKVLLFAGLQQAAGLSELNYALRETQDCQNVYLDLQARFSFPTISSCLRVAVNHQFVDWHQVLQPGDTLAFIPPVSGG